MSEDYCLLQLEVWKGAVSPPADRGQSPGVDAGNEAPGSSNDPAIHCIKKGAKVTLAEAFLSEPF